MPAEDGDIYMLRVGPADSPYVIEVEAVASPRALAQGLSGRERLDRGRGMLFIFPMLSRQSMWMPDMRFPLDIVWLDEQLSVVGIAAGVQPCATRSACPSVQSPYPIQYAIELNAGDAAAYGFSVGKSLAVVS